MTPKNKSVKNPKSLLGNIESVKKKTSVIPKRKIGFRHFIIKYFFSVSIIIELLIIHKNSFL